MDRLPIQDDEWIAGYLGRLASFNAYDTSLQLQQALRKASALSAQQALGRVSYIEIIASMLQMDLSTLLQNHSLWRLHRAFRTTAEMSEGSEKPIPYKQFKYVPQQFRQNLWLCPMCVHDDCNTILFSYWRRSHQVPGLTRCVRHDALLQGFPFVGFLNFTPDYVINNSKSTLQSLCDSEEADWIELTVKILHLILESERTIDQTAALNILREACRIDEFNNKSIRFSDISEDISKNLPPEWLRDYMPNILDINNYTGIVSNLFVKNPKSQPRPPATNVALIAARYCSSEKIAALCYGE